jgi:nicotinamidase-related amidase
VTWISALWRFGNLRSLVAIFNQQFVEHPDFSRRVLAWWPNYICGSWRRRIPRDDRHQCAAGRTLSGEQSGNQAMPIPARLAAMALRSFFCDTANRLALLPEGKGVLHSALSSVAQRRAVRTLTPLTIPLTKRQQEDVFMASRNGLASLLRPEDSVLVLIDHQPFQLTNLNSHDPHAAVNCATALAKAAKAFNVPTILTSVIGERGGWIFPQITDVFPGQEVIDRTLINTWEDKKVVDAVKATGRKQLIIAGLWTEVCVAMPAIQALGEGWDVTVVTDACGGVSVEAHQVAIQRMIGAGANVMTWLAVMAEWQRDWARLDTAGAVTEVLQQHAAGSGIAYLWEQQLLNTPVPVEG